MLSIIIPIYNSEKYLRECLESILCQQELTEYELLCVDDGSTDASSKILEEYESNSHVTVFHQDNLGAGVARNNGLSHATGDYIMFLDSDDTMVSGANTFRAYDYARKNDIDVLLCERNEMDADGTFICSYHPNTNLLPLGTKSIFHPKDAGLSLFRIVYNGPNAKLFKRRLIEDKALFFPSLRRSEDYIFVHLCMDYSERLSTLDIQLFNYRRNVPTSLEANKDSTPLIFMRANELYYEELHRRGLEAFIEPAKIHSLGFFLYNLQMMKTFEGYKIVFDKLPEYYKLYKPEVSADDPVYDSCQYAIKSIEEMIVCGDAGNYLLQKLRRTEVDVNRLYNTVGQLQGEINCLNRKLTVRVKNMISHLIHKFKSNSSFHK